MTLLFTATMVACGATAPPPKRPAPGPRAPPAPAPAAPTDAPDAQAFAAVEPEFAFLDGGRKAKLESAFGSIEAIVDDEMTRQKIPGFVLGIVVDGTLAYAKGFGFADVEKKTRPDADTVFRIGSITKSLTALAVLSLRDDGALRLDDPLTHFLPEAAGLVYPTHDAQAVTLRQLLTHTSGLPRQGNFGRPAPTEAELTRSLAGFALENVPGTTFLYSNLGFGLLGIAAGHAAHAPFREVVAKRILSPLGMASTVWDGESVPANRLATGYFLNSAGETRPVEDARLGAGEGAGGLYSSASDMARYLASQLDAYPPRSAPETGPLRRSTIREAHSTGFRSGMRVALADAPKKGESLIQAAAETYGFGWVSKQTCDFDDLVWHNGAIAGYTADIEFLYERAVGVIAMANLIPSDPSAVSARVLQALKRTGGLSKRSRAISPAFEPVMKQFLAVYNEWDEAGYKAMLRAGRTTIFDEKEELAGYKELHGTCKAYSPIEVKTPLDARFKMDCERGPFEMRVVLSANDGLIDGFVGISRDAPMSKDLRAAAERVTGLIRKWDEAVYKKHLAKSKKNRDETIALFNALRAVHGACLVKSSTLLASDRSIALMCERGGDLALVLALDKKDSSIVSSYAFGGVSEGLCPLR